MNSPVSDSPKVVATKLPTFTVAPGAKSIPSGFKSKTVPPIGPPTGPTLELSEPAIVEPPLPAATILRTDEFAPAAPSNSKTTPFFPLMLKEFQLIIEVVEDWLTVSKLPVVLGVAVPKDVEVYTGSIAANAD